MISGGSEEGYLKWLLEWIERDRKERGGSAEEQLARIKERLRKDWEAAKGGWL